VLAVQESMITTTTTTTTTSTTLLRLADPKQQPKDSVFQLPPPVRSNKKTSLSFSLEQKVPLQIELLSYTTLGQPEKLSDL